VARETSSGSDGATRWWSRGRGLPGATYASFATSLAARPARPGRILAWARVVDETDPNLVCIGTIAALSYGSAAGWTHGGQRGAVALAEPVRLPELFRERVAASIVVEKFIPLRGGRGVTISGRRDLGDSAAVVTWHATLGRGLSWQETGVRELADAAVADVSAEYDMR